MALSHPGEVRSLDLDQLGQNYRRYRLPDPEAEADLVGSLRRYGQLTPVVVCRRQETHEILDGFKRLAAARVLGWKTVQAQLWEADERAAKAAIYGLNQTGRRTQEWEDAWIVHALVRDDGLTQVEVAFLLGRHKSWVCRRLALVEKLAEPAREDLRLGLLSATAARSLVKLPPGNQTEVLATLHRNELTAAELDGVVNLLGATPGRSQQEYILAQPRQALQQARQETDLGLRPAAQPTGQPRGAAPGQRAGGAGPSGDLAAPPGPGRPDARRPPGPGAGFARLARDARSVAALVDDLIAEFHTHDRAHAQ